MFDHSRLIRKAYNTVIQPDGEYIMPAICIFDKEGNILSVEVLTEEQPYTEWVGGTLDLRSR